MKKDPFKIFNVNEFKRWMESSEPSSPSKLLGLSAVPKVTFKKLKEISEVLDNEKAIMEFHKNGGVVLEEENDLLMIRTKKGCLKIDKLHVNFL